MINLKGIGSFLAAKGMGHLLPALSKSPKLMDALFVKLQDSALERIWNHPDNTPEVRDRKHGAARMLFGTFRKRLPTYAPEVQRKLAVNMLYNSVHVGEEVRSRYRARFGEEPPFFFVVSPSMRCNLRCTGCYAWKYRDQGELSAAEVIDLVEQGKRDLGTYFVVLSGGEPTFWPGLIELLEKHSDVFFQIYTHGMNFDEALCRRFAELGNAYPAISIEGDEASTDARRGPGSYRKITEAMCRLRDHGVPFGFSVTHTRLNHDAITSDEFGGKMAELGATFGWVFQYIPIGREPNMELVPTAEQRVQRFEAVERFRGRYPYIVFDFWNDGEATSGCIAWGKRYFHVNSAGNVEPCVFVHFAKDNIREKKLIDIIQGPVFKDARSMMPFDPDYRLPCSFIDNVDVLPSLVRKHGMFPTHEGAETIINELAPAVRANAQAYRKVLADNPDAVRAAYTKTFAGEPADGCPGCGGGCGGRSG
jgi:MoaA/NifB/PqqE/SkfB family radical SAM enzyme